VIRRLRERARQDDERLRDVPAAMRRDAQAQAERLAQLKSENAPLARIQQAERQQARAPRSEDEARAQYQRERDRAPAHARPLAGMPPQAQPFAAGDPQGDAASRRAYEGARANFLALMLCLMMGTAALPHVLTRCYTTPSVSEARRSVGWS